MGVEPEVRDVDGDPKLFDVYDFRVPVVLVDGRVVGEGRTDSQALKRALSRGGGQDPASGTLRQ